MNSLIYLLIINTIGLITCFLDKILAIKHLYRIPESLLLFICSIGGCYGFTVGMHLFHHKTKKNKFKAVYLLCIIWLYIIINNN